MNKNISAFLPQYAKEIIAIFLGHYVANWISPLFDYSYEGQIEPMFAGYSMFQVGAFFALLITPFTGFIFWLIFKFTTRKRSIGFLKILGVAFFAQLLSMAIFALGNGVGGAIGGFVLLPVVSSMALNLLAGRKVFPIEAKSVA